MHLLLSSFREEPKQVQQLLDLQEIGSSELPGQVLRPLRLAHQAILLKFLP
jgi:hypothetical protein